MNTRGKSYFDISIEKNPLEDRYVVIPNVRFLGEFGGGIAMREGLACCSFADLVPHVRRAIAASQEVRAVSEDNPLIMKDTDLMEVAGTKNVINRWYNVSFSVDTEGIAGELPREKNTLEVNPLQFTGRGSIGQRENPRFILPLDASDEQIGDAIKKSFDWIQENFGHLVKGKKGE